MMEISEMFKALAVETRVRILELLKTQGPLGAKEIARLTGVTPAAASQHLKVLKQAGTSQERATGILDTVCPQSRGLGRIPASVN